MTFTILYEDSKGPTPEFGLHRLVTQCVFDTISEEYPDYQYYQIKRCLKDRQAKGDSKLLRKCREDVDAISRSGCPVIAVFDNDRVRSDLLHLQHNVTDAEVRAEILKGKTGTTPLCIVLLKENTESVLSAIGECSPELDPDELTKAVKRKDPNARDIVFHHAAKARERAVRECVLNATPSLKELVDGLCHLLRAAFRAACPI